MTHPITPPFELVRQWSADSPIQYNNQDWAYELFIAHHAPNGAPTKSWRRAVSGPMRPDGKVLVMASVLLAARSQRV